MNRLSDYASPPKVERPSLRRNGKQAPILRHWTVMENDNGLTTALILPSSLLALQDDRAEMILTTHAKAGEHVVSADFLNGLKQDFFCPLVQFAATTNGT